MDKKALTYDLCKKKFLCHQKHYDGSRLFELKESKHADYYPEAEGADFFNRFNWMTSFVTGLAPLYYETEGGSEYIIWANRFKRLYQKKVSEYELETMHDLGFLYVPYSVEMYRLTGDCEHKRTALAAADVLLKRFDIKAGFIDAWGKMNDEKRGGRAIIDCMMNLELLLWAYRETGHTIYRDVAEAHADNTIKWFIRDDYSVCHSFDFSRETGEVLGENNGCGYENGSWWARGCAWAVYGLAMMCAYTGDKKYFFEAQKTAKAYIEQLNGKEFVPVWDFRLPKGLPAAENPREGYTPEWDETDEKNLKLNKDTSACAIMACAIMTLDKIEKTEGFAEFVTGSLDELCDFYVNKDETASGILSHQNGRMMYTTYGDYYFAKALKMYLHNFGKMY